MKNSVNGKSFDEIFEQRGKKVQISELKKGDSHLHLNKNRDIWLSVFDGMRDTDSTNVGTSSCLCFDGFDSCVNCEGRDMGFYDGDTASFYEATPDQIDLLNSYK